MDNAPTQIIIAAYNDEKSASLALDDLKQAAKDDLIKIDDAAVLSRDVKGKLHIKETADMTAGKGAVIGGALGAAVSLLAGPVGWVAAGGAIVGGLSAGFHDAGFSNKRLKQLGEALVADSSAIVAVVKLEWMDGVKSRLEQKSSEIYTFELGDDIESELAKGNEVTVTTTADGEDVATAPVVDEPPPASPATD